MQAAVSKLAFLLGITMILNSVQPVISGGYLAHTIRHLLKYVFGLNEYSTHANFSSSSSFAGVAVGGGWQALVAYINLFCYYIVGLPLGFLLGYKTSLRVEVKILELIYTSFSTHHQSRSYLKFYNTIRYTYNSMAAFM